MKERRHDIDWLRIMAILLVYAVFFLIGYVMVADQRFTEGIKKHGWICLVLGIIGFGSEGYFVFVLRYNYANLYHPGGEPFSLRYMLLQIVMSAATWSWVAFMLSLALYELLVRRFNAIRFLFGMRLTKRAIGEQPASSR